MRGAIFDLDGTLIDSMGLWDEVDIKLLSKYGIVPDKEYSRKIAELTFSEGINYIINRYGIDRTPSDIENELNELAYYEYDKNIVLKDNAYDFIKKLHDSGFKLAIATSSMRNMCEVVLKRNGVIQFFNELVFSDEVGKNKNFPDIYLKAAEKIGVPPNECYVFEDVPHAAAGAKMSGAKVVGVYDSYSADKEQEMRKICDIYINDFSEFNFGECYE